MVKFFQNWSWFGWLSEKRFQSHLPGSLWNICTHWFGNIISLLRFFNSRIIQSQRQYRSLRETLLSSFFRFDNKLILPARTPARIQCNPSRRLVQFSPTPWRTSKSFSSLHLPKRIWKVLYYSYVTPNLSLHIPHNIYLPCNKDSVTSFDGLFPPTVVSLGSRCPIEIQNSAWWTSSNPSKASIKHFTYKSTSGLRDDVIGIFLESRFHM